jgi:UDP-N-acetylmuramyl pentapeptide phosphotransferase/UDP-N-acetylglucosamine-1-phosphate transferase
MATTHLLVAIVSGITTWITSRVIAGQETQNPFLVDDLAAELRKVHVDPTPRVGGLALASGIAAGAVVEMILTKEFGVLPWLLLCASPALIWGLIEDVSKRGASLVRLFITALASTISFIVLDARITQVDVPVIDQMLYFHFFSFAFTVVAVTGVAHAINVIDGLNGLAGFASFVAAAGLAVVALLTDDFVVLSGASALAAVVFGFLIVNFPRGKIFLGDGGAYLIGLLLAQLSVLLVHRNSEVSPWFPLLLLAYPVWETLFSMYRRHARGKSTGQADALHLHTLIYHRIVRWRGHQASAADYATRNSVASALLWLAPAVCSALAVFLWDSSLRLQIVACCFALAYVLVYRRLVRFGVPSWLVIRARKPKAVAETAGEPAEV